MKKQIILFISALCLISEINAGSSFWGGFGLGTFSGMLSNEIVHHAYHHHPRKEVVVHRSEPVRYIEVERPIHYEIKTVKAEPIFNELREEKRALYSENQCLKSQIHALEDDLDTAYAKNHVMEKRIDSLTKKLNNLENSVEKLNQKLKKSSTK